MSTPQSTPQNSDIGTQVDMLKQRVEALTHTLTGECRRVERKRKTFIAVGATLAVLSTVGFWTLTSMAFQLDAEALARIGRYKFESQLPASRERMHAYLAAKAPEITSYAIGAMISCVPSVRPFILGELESQFAVISKDFETRLSELMDEAFTTSKAQLDSKYPGLSDTERVEKLVSLVADKFVENVQNLYAEIYPSYAAQIAGVEDYINGLKSKPAGQLTARERAEKELIQTLLALIVKEQEEQGAAK